MCDFTAKRKYSAHEKSVPKPMMSYRTDSRGNIEPAPEILGRECYKENRLGESPSQAPGRGDDFHWIEKHVNVISDSA